MEKYLTEKQPDYNQGMDLIELNGDEIWYVSDDDDGFNLFDNQEPEDDKHNNRYDPYLRNSQNRNITPLKNKNDT